MKENGVQRQRPGTSSQAGFPAGMLATDAREAFNARLGWRSAQSGCVAAPQYCANAMRTGLSNCAFSLPPAQEGKSDVF
jgi:hypothetical protein